MCHQNRFEHAEILREETPALYSFVCESCDTVLLRKTEPVLRYRTREAGSLGLAMLIGYAVVLLGFFIIDTPGVVQPISRSVWLGMGFVALLTTPIIASAILGEKRGGRAVRMSAGIGLFSALTAFSILAITHFVRPLSFQIVAGWALSAFMGGGASSIAAARQFGLRREILRGLSACGASILTLGACVALGGIVAKDLSLWNHPYHDAFVLAADLVSQLTVLTTLLSLVLLSGAAAGYTLCRRIAGR